MFSTVSGTMAAGLYFRHYFVVFVFSVWCAIEFLLWRFPALLSQGSRLTNRVRFHRLTSLLKLYGRFDTVSEHSLAEKIREMRTSGSLTEYEDRWLSRLKDLLEIRGLVLGKEVQGKLAVRRAFAYSVKLPPISDTPRSNAPFENLSLQDITESAMVVADLYWKLFDTCQGEFTDLSLHARELFQEIFGVEFEMVTARAVVEGLIDSMQRDHGVPFLVLNLIRTGNWPAGRSVAQQLLTSEIDVDSEIRSALYWVSEINWFVKEDKTFVSDYQSTIRYLYHLCFTNPERVGFLEVDSQFFSQFEVVNEIAREGFLFKETLVEKLLELWQGHEGYFDPLFQSILEQMTQQKNKIYDERENWEIFWKRESANFGKDYLYVVEGNIAYANGHFADAQLYYEKALKLNPRLRPALLNQIFCAAKLGDKEHHAELTAKLLGEAWLMPSSLYVIANSHLLLGDKKQANLYYEELKKQRGWERKTEFYQSTFCFENGLYEEALAYARLAHEQNPTDSSINYHLSLCYNAVGEKDQALNMVKTLDEAPQWLNYYRFTLERDAGRLKEASETLMSIPSEYFEDSEELEEALEFARDREDLNLLRHLRKKEG